MKNEADREDQETKKEFVAKPAEEKKLRYENIADRLGKVNKDRRNARKAFGYVSFSKPAGVIIVRSPWHMMEAAPLLDPAHLSIVKADLTLEEFDAFVLEAANDK